MLTCNSEKCMTYLTFVYERVEYGQFISISSGHRHVSMNFLMSFSKIVYQRGHSGKICPIPKYLGWPKIFDI